MQNMRIRRVGLVTVSGLFPLPNITHSTKPKKRYKTTHQPVSQELNAECFGGASIAAQKYGPPLVGMADTISAIPSATAKVKNDTTIQPTDITALVPSAFVRLSCLLGWGRRLTVHRYEAHN